MNVVAHGLIHDLIQLIVYNDPKNSDSDIRWLAVSESERKGTFDEDTAQPLLFGIQGQAGPGSGQGRAHAQRDRQRRPGASEPADAVEASAPRKPARHLRGQADQREQGAGSAHRPTLPADRATQGRVGLAEKKS